MIVPLIALAAQLIAKQQQEEEARRRETAKLAQERAARLGGNTMGAEAANFNRELKNQSYGSPDQLLKIYGSFGQGKKAKPTDGATSTTPGSDGLLNPWGPGNAGPSNAGAASGTGDASALSDGYGGSADAAGSLLEEDDPYGIGATV